MCVVPVSSSSADVRDHEQESITQTTCFTIVNYHQNQCDHRHTYGLKCRLREAGNVSNKARNACIVLYCWACMMTVSSPHVSSQKSFSLSRILSSTLSVSCSSSVKELLFIFMSKLCSPPPQPALLNYMIMIAINLLHMWQPGGL